MTSKQKRLLAAAADLLASLSSGTLDRAIRFAHDRKGGGYSSTVCIPCERVNDLYEAVEALWPGLVAKAHKISQEQLTARQKAQREREAKENAERAKGAEESAAKWQGMMVDWRQP